jgi:hypothetical protein
MPISPDSIRADLARHRLQQKDLCAATGIDKYRMSLAICGKRPYPEILKAARDALDVLIRDRKAAAKKA